LLPADIESEGTRIITELVKMSMSKLRMLS